MELEPLCSVLYKLDHTREGAQGHDLAPFFGNFRQSEKSSEIKPPLTGAKNVSLL